MALQLKLKPNERFVVEGVVLKNGPKRTTIEVCTRANVMREAHAMKPEAADTQVKKLYFVLQCMLLDSGPNETAEQDYAQRLSDLRTVFRGNQTVLEKLDEVDTRKKYGEFFKAMRAVDPLLKYEETLLAYSKVLQNGDDPLADAADPKEVETESS